MSAMGGSRGLTVEGRSRALVAYDADYREWGVGGQVRVGPGRGGRGLALSVQPVWGQTSSGVERLWNDGLIDSPTTGGEPRSSVAAIVSYGLAAFGGDWLVTPNGGLALFGEGTRSVSLGGRLELAPTFKVSLEGERREPAGAPAEHTVSPTAKLRW